MLILLLAQTSQEIQDDRSDLRQMFVKSRSTSFLVYGSLEADAKQLWYLFQISERIKGTSGFCRTIQLYVAHLILMPSRVNAATAELKQLPSRT